MLCNHLTLSWLSGINFVVLSRLDLKGYTSPTRSRMAGSKVMSLVAWLMSGRKALSSAYEHTKAIKDNF